MVIAMKAVQFRRKQVAVSFLLLSLGCPPLLWSWLSSTSPAREARVEVLIERGAPFYLQASRAFRQKFPLDVTVNYVEGDLRELTATIDGLRKDPPELVVVFGTQAAIAAKTRLRDVPIIYCLALDPLKNGLSGPNIGGIRLQVDLSQQFAELERFLPRATRIGIIYSEPESGDLVRRARARLSPGLRLVARDAHDSHQAAQLIEEIIPLVDAFFLQWDPVIANVANFRRLVDLSLKNRVALITPAPAFVEAGALMSVAADYEKAGQRASEMARLVLEGRRAGDFGNESPPASLITINAAVARQLGIEIPAGLPAEILSPGVASAFSPGGL